MSWVVVIPFKGTPDAKSRLAEAYPERERRALARAFLYDTISAVRAVPQVAAVLVVSDEPGLGRALGSSEGIAPALPLAKVEVVGDPGRGLNAAIAHGIREYRAGSGARAHVAVLLGDLPELKPGELAEALAAAEGHPLAFVPDRAGTGTTMITLAPGVDAEPLFGVGSAAAHTAAGFVALDVPEASGLRRDVDSPDQLAAVERAGAFTRPLLRR